MGYTVIVALGLLGQQKYHAVSSFQPVNFDCFNLILIRPSVDPWTFTISWPSLRDQGMIIWHSGRRMRIAADVYKDILLIYWVYFLVFSCGEGNCGDDLKYVDLSFFTYLVLMLTLSSEDRCWRAKPHSGAHASCKLPRFSQEIVFTRRFWF